MTHTEIVKKLIGPIQPLGDASQDPQRLENLKILCNLVDELVQEIDSVHYDNQHSKEHSVMTAAKYADNFLENGLGICG